MKSPSNDSTVSIASTFGGVSFDPVIARTPSFAANRPSSEAVLPVKVSLPSRQPVRSRPLKMGLKPGSSAPAAETNVETNQRQHARLKRSRMLRHENTPDRKRQLVPPSTIAAPPLTRKSQLIVSRGRQRIPSHAGKPTPSARVIRLPGKSRDRILHRPERHESKSRQSMTGGFCCNDGAAFPQSTRLRPRLCRISDGNVGGVRLRSGLKCNLVHREGPGDRLDGLDADV